METTQLSSHKRGFCFTKLFLSLLFSLCLCSALINTASAQETKSTTATQATELSDTDKAQQIQLQQELTKLLAENSRINKEKIEYLEAQSQKVFWTQCLIGFLVVMMLVSLFSFWRLHVQHQFQDGIDALTTSIRSFQDSLFSLSFIDTSQLSTVGSVSSFHTTGTDTENTTQGGNSRFKKTLNPNTGDEFSDIRGFFDAWLNVYKPGDPRYEEALAAATKPNSPKPWLQKLDSSRQNKDQSAFEAVSKDLKKFFNIRLLPWQTPAAPMQKQLSDYPHVINKIIELWPGDEVVIYLERLLNNSRMSPREGFDLNIFLQLESLLELAQREDRPRQINQLRELGGAEFLFVTPSSTSLSATLATMPNLAPDSISQPKKAFEPVPKKSIAMLGELAPPITINAEKTTPTITEDKSTVSRITPTKEDPTQTANAHEVRLQLALAYLEMADSEGACLLLEEIIRDATPAQQAHAKRLLEEIEKKRADLDANSRHTNFH